MITEDYCSYEVAKLLKEKGFDEGVDHVYLYFTEDDIQITELSYPKKCQSLKPHSYPHITHQMAMKWLREKGVYMSIDTFISSSESIYFSIDTYSEDFGWNHPVNLYDSYEEAVEATLKYCLENLI